ncbi:MAG: histidinol dehydrogenase [Deltaproteobacteria bacterium]|nr:histidinol dehydrogenase [Deltaproteobacteria bacterium]
MRIFNFYDQKFKKEISEIINRKHKIPEEVKEKVEEILAEVYKKGNRAISHYTKVFDGISLATTDFEISRKRWPHIISSIDNSIIQSFEKAAERIRRFHEHQKEKGFIDTEQGIITGQFLKPLERVGIYVPGGKAIYPSTVLMNAIPAKVAGVKEIIMVTPPRAKGIDPCLILAASISGVNRLFQIGGVQAIAALAYGTATIPKVDKIVGPGNIYVAAAKEAVFGEVDIDSIAGPTEILIISDDKSDPDFVAVDLISQAEHDEDAYPWLITTSSSFAKDVVNSVEKHLKGSKRKSIVKSSLKNHGMVVIVPDISTAIELANEIAPEHLELLVDEPFLYIDSIKNAGTIFIGQYTPEAIGDYIAGANHVLPTSGTARFFSPLGVYDFVKRVNFIYFSKDALKQDGEDVIRMATIEKLDGHAKAISERIKKG